MTLSDTVLIDQPAEGVTRLTMNRPDKLNALTLDMVQALHTALDAVDADHDCRAVILTGAGFGTVPGTEDLGRVQQGMATQQLIAEIVHHMRDVRQPIISAVNGAAAGGGFAFACASDIRYCSESAKFGTAFVRLGLSGCDIGVSWMLPRLIGASRAWELLLTGRVFDAAEAERIGLVSRMVPDNALEDTVMGVAAEIAANSPFGVWMTKEAMWSNLEIPSLRAGIDLENRNQIMASQTSDARLGMSSLPGQHRDWTNS
jgi:enoyl-CoA hydratase